MSSSDASTNRSIRISYTIAIPAGASVTPELAATRSSTQVIPVPKQSDLPNALDSARSVMNGILTQWKDAIGEAEKLKEVEAAKLAQEQRRNIRANGNNENDEQDGSDEDDDADE